MSDGSHSTIIGVRKRNSVDFIRTVFDAYRTKTLIALLDDEQEIPQLKGFTPGRIEAPESGGGWFSSTVEVPASKTPGQIVFTSGTEGEPKAVLLSYEALADPVERLNAAMRVDASIREYIGVPVTHSFGLGRCRAVAAAGGSFFLPEKGFDPIEIRRMLSAGEINAISAVPTLLRVLLNDPSLIGDLGARVKWVEIGSQYMSRDEKEGVKRLFPNAVILQHYGLTEASRSTFLLINDEKGEALESVGQPFGDVEVRISSEGLIQVRGPHLASGVIKEGELHPLVDDEGWLTTGDKGDFTPSGLFFHGRADDLINCGGIKVDPAQIEREVASKIEPETEFAIARTLDPVRGEGFFVAVVDGAGDVLKRIETAVGEALRDHGIAAGSALRVENVREIPLTDTGKVRRNELVERYWSPPETAQQNVSRGGGVHALYRQLFSRDDIPPSASFRDLSGDSLTYVEMSIALEKELGELPIDWDSLPISSLAALEGKNREAPRRLEIGTPLRALAITCVVAAHSGLLMLGGGTFLLFFLIGHNLARFKAATFLSGKFIPDLLRYTKVLLIPYFLLAVLYMAYQGEFKLDLVLLYTNVTELRLTQIFPFWFVQVLVQCLALTSIYFLVPPVRQFAKAQPWPFALGTTAVLVIVWALFPLVWDTDYLNNLVPQRYVALLWLGWCCYSADTPARRMLALALGLSFALIDSGISRNAAWIALGVVATLYLPTISVSPYLRKAIQFVAAATFYIFALNGIIAWIIITVFERVLGSAPGPLVFLLTMAACLTSYYLIRRIQELAASVRSLGKR